MKSLKHSFQTKPICIHFSSMVLYKNSCRFFVLTVFLVVILKFGVALINVRHDSDQRHQDASRTDFMEIQGDNL